jgi:hypothetical protein
VLKNAIKTANLKLILHTESSIEAINEKRLLENYALTHQQRMKIAFELMKLSFLFKKDVLKRPNSNGITLRLK